MFMIWMQFLIDLFTVWSEDTWLQEYAGKTADKKSTEDPDGETEKSVVSSMVTCRSVRPNNECLKNLKMNRSNKKQRMSSFYDPNDQFNGHIERKI